MSFQSDADRVDVLVLGAGAAGLFCAIHAAGRGARVLVLDHAKAPGEKIRISGGGRCNFTNTETRADRFLSQNPHFAKSALARYGAWDFIGLVASHGIPYHEKTLGQQFCDNSAKDIIALLLDELDRVGAGLRLQTSIVDIAARDGGYAVMTERDGVRREIPAAAVVVATGGKSIPKMGATGFGYRVAEQFGLDIVETRPGLVPLTFGGETQERMKALAGVAAPHAVAKNDRIGFPEAVLFTHRGLSGPAILQLSSYWREGEAIQLDFWPGGDAFGWLKAERQANGRRATSTVLGAKLPKRLAQAFVEISGLGDGPIGAHSDAALDGLASLVGGWRLTPTGSEGYRTAEVTLGGVDTDGLDGRTMEAKSAPGLYFIGEVVDVTGWLGGYNFQWAWASGRAAGEAV